MTATMTYEVAGIEKWEDPVSGEEIGGDAEGLEDFDSKAKAFAFAKKESRKNKWHEVQVREQDERGELTGHWYFKNGRMTWNMGL
jgi:hypothetical protein